jgi:hypothetical protein
MNVAQNEEVHLSFTPEQQHALAMLYGFLIQLGRQRLKRLQQRPNEATEVEDHTRTLSCGGQQVSEE